jgi:hypothetical protein
MLAQSAPTRSLSALPRCCSASSRPLRQSCTRSVPLAFGPSNNRWFDCANNTFNLTDLNASATMNRKNRVRRILLNAGQHLVHLSVAVRHLRSHASPPDLDPESSPLSDVENPQTAQAVEIPASADGAEGVGPGIGPFYNRGGTLQVGRLAGFEETRIHVIAERGDRFAGDPGCVSGSDFALRD